MVLVEHMPDRYQALVLLGAWCGLRFGEMAELRRADLDLATGVVHVRRGVVRITGQVSVGTPKSAAGVRDVAIPPHLLPTLAEHLATHVGPAPEALVFPRSPTPRFRSTPTPSTGTGTRRERPPAGQTCAFTTCATPAPS